MHYHCRLVLCFALLSLLLSVTAKPVKKSALEGSKLKHNPYVENDIDDYQVHRTDVEDMKDSKFGSKVGKKTTTTSTPEHKSNENYEYSWGTPINENSLNDAIAQVTFKHTPELYYYGVAEAGPRHLKVVYFNRHHQKPRKQRKQNNKRYRY